MEETKLGRNEALQVEQGGAMMEHRIVAEALTDYLEMMERGAYFEAHERLESVWYPMRKEKSDLAYVLKGLINAAVAFEHLKRGRPQAAERAARVIRAYDRYESLCNERFSRISAFEKACSIVKSLKRSHKELFDVSLSS